MSLTQKLELKIPPVIVGVAVAILMKCSAGMAPWLAFAPLHQPEIATALAVTGVLIASAGVFSFRRAHTTIDPRYPQNVSALVTSGIYHVTRNPMYLGMLTALASWALWLGHLLPVLFLPVFIATMNRFQIQPEERALIRRFGIDFTDYCARVRRWL
jgi:protein-S-isoprenylcysteine O-methyltransferase Ste14